MVAKAGNRACAMSITFPLLLPLLLPFLLLPFASSESSSYGADIAIEEVVRRLESKRAPVAVQEAAAQGVLRRLLPTHVSSFRFQIASQGLCKRFGCFRLSSINGSGGDGPEILIQGTTGVELSFGLHWYLKYWCGAHISWDKTGGNQLGTVPPPGSLPHVEGEGVKVERPVPWSYYQNVVTSSYSFAFWDWKRWEKEIDWMALHGINLPLAFTGQEAVWKKVLKRFNVSTEDLNGFFGGPAFLAWARMGNLHGWGGPLSENWLTQQLSMQKQILSRMVDLGITPVLPSFSGNVPAVFTKIFPTASITRLGDWNTVDGDTRWCCTYLLDPSDPLFVEVGAAFINQQIKEYGDITDIYSCDTFNENTPPTSDPTYIASLGAAVYKAMSKGDNDAIWLMQGWLFSSSASFWKPPQMKALLHSVPVGKMIVLDLFAEVRPIWQRSSHFYGVPYVWCMLHNFGGNIEMYGILDSISIGPIDARMSQNSTMVGVGMCMEGIEQNPVVYELMSEMAFRHQQVEVHKWLKSYSFRRYGHSIPQIQAAWDILYHTIYNCTDGIENHNRDYILEFLDQSPLPMNTQLTNGRLFQRFSRLKKSLRILIKRHGPETRVPHLWYPTEDVVNALKLFLQAGDDVGRSSPYRYDLADLARQVLSKLANQAYLDVMAAYQRKDPQELTLYSHKFLEFIQDIEELLASNENFLLGTWLESAKSLAITDGERKQYEWNARTQITMWYDNTMTNQSKLHDYGNKFWSGLLRSYYLPRASSYFSYLSRSLQENEDFRLEEWRKDWISYSNSWQSGNELYPTEAKGDTLLIAKSLFQKYYG